MDAHFETRIPGTRLNTVPIKKGGTRAREGRDGDDTGERGAPDDDVVLEPQPRRAHAARTVSRELLEDEAGRHIDLRG